MERDIGMVSVKNLVKLLVREKEETIKVLLDFGSKPDQMSLPVMSRSLGSTVVANNVTFARIDDYVAYLRCVWWRGNTSCVWRLRL